MTDRLNALTVVLDRDIRVDDAEGLINAINLLNGVLSVTGNVSDITEHIASMRAEEKVRTRVLDALFPERSTN